MMCVNGEELMTDRRVGTLENKVHEHDLELLELRKTQEAVIKNQERIEGVTEKLTNCLSKIERYIVQIKWCAFGALGVAISNETGLLPLIKVWLGL